MVFHLYHHEDSSRIGDDGLLQHMPPDQDEGVISVESVQDDISV